MGSAVTFATEVELTGTGLTKTGFTLVLGLPVVLTIVGAV